MVCCRVTNKGTTFLVNGQWNPNHDYGDINQVRDILQKIQDAGINTVSVDFTNPSQWTIFKDTFIPMLKNINQVTAEKGMQMIVFIGAQLTEDDKRSCGIPMEWDAFQFWDACAKVVWDEYAQQPNYRRFGADGDNRPILLAFLPGEAYWPQYNSKPAEWKTYLSRFYIGTSQVNDPINFGPTDGWGYRNFSANDAGTIRFASTNAGVNPTQFQKVSEDEWQNRVRWAAQASLYTVIGSYDDTCDQINWGIADTSSHTGSDHYPGDNPYVYYDVVKQELLRAKQQQQTMQLV
jgi:hypothetical protein